LSSLWLNSRRRDVYSQNGEDGVIEAIFQRIGVSDEPWCCEFGAHDGFTFSNTANLSWPAVLIEPNPELFDKLAASSRANHGNVLMQRYVGVMLNKLDDLLQQTHIPKNFDLLSIDVDGEDLAIWNGLSHYVPRVVIIEVDSCQAPGTGPSQRSMGTLEEAVALGKRKGYELALHTGNAIFVRCELAQALEIDPNNWQELFDRRWIECKR
jgi:hypothetical protein